MTLEGSFFFNSGRNLTKADLPYAYLAYNYLSSS